MQGEEVLSDPAPMPSLPEPLTISWGFHDMAFLPSTAPTEIKLLQEIPGTDQTRAQKRLLRVLLTETRAEPAGSMLHSRPWVAAEGPQQVAGMKQPQGLGESPVFCR